MTPSPAPWRIRAAILAEAVPEDDAVCHQNIADDLGVFVAATAGRWRASPAAYREPAPDLPLLFAGLADVLSDTFCGLSSGHLQALNAARGETR